MQKDSYVTETNIQGCNYVSNHGMQSNFNGDILNTDEVRCGTLRNRPTCDEILNEPRVPIEESYHQGLIIMTCNHIE